MKGFLVFSSFISALLLSFQLLKIFAARHDYMARLKRYIIVEEAKEVKKRDRRRDAGAGIGEALSKGIGKIRFLDGYKKKILVYLTRAHLPLKPEEFLSLSLILFCLFSSILLLLKGITNWPFAIAAGILGWLLPLFIIKNKIKKRIKLFDEQLGDAITMMSNSLKTGYSFFQAIDMVADEMSGPVAQEFGILKKEINLGQNTEKALDNIVWRTPSDDLELVITAVLIQRQVGGNLAEVLDNITATIRDRIKIKGELKAITAQGRISGLIISVLPFVICGIIYMLDPKMMTLLFIRPLGQVMLGVSLFMEIIGIILIKRIVNVEI